MSSGTNTQANMVLDYLKENGYGKYGRGIKTGPLLARCGLNTEMDHKEFRKMLLRLHSAGLLSKVGLGSFEWRLQVESWDRFSPFRRLSSVPTPTYAPSKPITPSKPVAEPTPEVDNTFTKTALSALATALQSANDEIANLKKDLEKKTELLQNQIQAVEDLTKISVKTIEIKRYDGKVFKLKDKVLPKVFDRTLALAKCRRNLLLVGPAGCGKTYLAKLIAETLGLDFGSLSCTAGISESHLLGRGVPNLTTGENVFQGAAFLDCYEEGGVFLLDEVDAADSNLMLCINTGLANGYLNIPNRRKKPRAVRHPDFICIATANTFGRGANRQYAGRNQLDEATLDRFRIGIVEMGYDPSVELRVCPDIGGEADRVWNTPAIHDENSGVERLVQMGYNLRQTCQYIRHKISLTGLRRIMSTRFMEDAYVMMKEGGWDLKTVLEAFFEGWTPEEKAKVI